MDHPMNKYPYINKTPITESEWIAALTALARYLRTPEGCPWDRKQTALSFARFLREEAEEYEEACVSGDPEHMAEEWGDVLFTLLASIAAAEESGTFTLETALRGIHEKMIRRHEHVFGENKATTPEEASAMWDRVKAQERCADQRRNPEI